MQCDAQNNQVMQVRGVSYDQYAEKCMKQKNKKRSMDKDSLQKRYATQDKGKSK